MRLSADRAVRRKRAGTWEKIRIGLVAAVVALSGTAAWSQQERPDPGADGKGKELGEKLIRTAGAGGEEDLMEGIARMMNEAARRLEIDFDAGEATQAIQKRITDGLDEAIKIAASQRRARSQSGRPQSSDKRRRPKDGKRRAHKGADKSTENDSGSSSESTPAGGSRPGGASGTGDLKDPRRSWGNLPRREREEVIQGAGERSLERFREWIERYYQALQESDETGSR